MSQESISEDGEKEAGGLSRHSNQMRPQGEIQENAVQAGVPPPSKRKGNTTHHKTKAEMEDGIIKAIDVQIQILRTEISARELSIDYFERDISNLQKMRADRLKQISPKEDISVKSSSSENLEGVLTKNIESEREKCNRHR